jgi:hypothetical protein
MISRVTALGRIQRGCDHEDGKENPESEEAMDVLLWGGVAYELDLLWKRI